VVIAIDGPGGVGKSTVSRAVAAALHLEHLDTGATYRAAALAALRAGADLEDADAVTAAVADASIEYVDGVVYLDGESVAAAVRTHEVTTASSRVSTIPEVRELVVEIQRDWVASRGGSAVVEGRDIGTVVFPDARVKVFLTARPEVRADRRAGDPEAAGRDVVDIAHELLTRDRRDAHREVSPMKPADDAVVIDTSALDAEAVITQVLELVEKAEQRETMGPL
jgi:cytidylate kinase